MLFLLYISIMGLEIKFLNCKGECCVDLTSPCRSGCAREPFEAATIKEALIVARASLLRRSILLHYGQEFSLSVAGKS